MNKVKKTFLALSLLASANSAFAGYFDWVTGLKANAKKAWDSSSAQVLDKSQKAIKFVKDNPKYFGIGSLVALGSAVASYSAYKYRDSISEFGRNQFENIKNRCFNLSEKYNQISDSKKSLAKKTALAGAAGAAALVAGKLAWDKYNKVSK